MEQCYSFKLHCKQWWDGRHGSYFRWLMNRYASNYVMVCLPVLFVLGTTFAPAIAKPLYTHYIKSHHHEQPRDVAYPPVQTLRVSNPRSSKKKIKPKLYLSDMGAVLIGAVISGFKGAPQRSWYESNRLNPSGITTTWYVNFDAVSNGDGTSAGTAFNNLAVIRIRFPQPGDRFEIWGTWNGAARQAEWASGLKFQGSGGTSSNWIHYRVRPGYSCSLDMSGVQSENPINFGNGSAYYICLEGFNCIQRKAPSSNPPDQCVNSQQTHHFAIYNLTCNGKVETAYSGTQVWVEGCNIDLQVTQVLSPGENAGDCLTIGGQPGTNGDSHVAYRNQLRNPGHVCVSLSANGNISSWATNCRIGFNDLSAPWCAGIAAGICTDCIVECNVLHDIGTQTSSVALSKEALQVSGLRTIVRYNYVYNWGNFGILAYLGSFSGYSQHCIDCQCYNNTFWNGLGFPLFVNARDYVADGEFRGLKLHNNLAWNYHNRGITGDATTDYSYGYFEGYWYDIIIQGPSANPTSPCFINWRGSNQYRRFQDNQLMNNMFGSSRNAGTTRFMLYVASLPGNASYPTQADALADALGMNSGNLAGHVQNTDPGFISTDSANSNFLAISSGSAAKNAGINTIGNIPYTGSAPDIGLWEAG